MTNEEIKAKRAKVQAASNKVKEKANEEVYHQFGSKHHLDRLRNPNITNPMMHAKLYLHHGGSEKLPLTKDQHKWAANYHKNKAPDGLHYDKHWNLAKYHHIMSK